MGLKLGIFLQILEELIHIERGIAEVFKLQLLIYKHLEGSETEPSVSIGIKIQSFSCLLVNKPIKKHRMVGSYTSLQNNAPLCMKKVVSPGCNSSHSSTEATSR